jgi:phytoene dehydrogenase-like protein
MGQSCGEEWAVRYDAAIIGAGTNGLAAAATLARADLKVIVLERAAVCGGRAATREFHPGFRASPFADDLAPIPVEIFRALDLARHGAIRVPAPSSLALWPDRRNEVLHWAENSAFDRLLEAANKCAEEIRQRAFADASHREERRWFGAQPAAAPWPGEDWSHRSLADVLDEHFSDPDMAAHLMASALGGRAADPFLNGSALHLLMPATGGIVMGGLSTLGNALETAARAAGAEISLGLDVSDIRLRGQRAVGLHLADGTRIDANAVISTLDLRRTFFSLFVWNDLPQAVVGRVTSYRYVAGRARLLLALDAPPSFDAVFAQGPIHVSPSAVGFAKAHDDWRSGVVPEHPPLTLRLTSAGDPSLAPRGKAVLTATLGCIPHHLFDGAWTNEKRNALRDRTLAEIETVLPGITGHVVGSTLIVPPDMEEQLGITEGDLEGGEIAPDQMFGQRGFAQYRGSRTPIHGLYLGGTSSASGTCTAGVTAARALMADLA